MILKITFSHYNLNRGGSAILSDDNDFIVSVKVGHLIKKSLIQEDALYCVSYM